jgi:hypothetical protein
MDAHRSSGRPGSGTEPRPPSGRSLGSRRVDRGLREPGSTTGPRSGRTAAAFAAADDRVRDNSSKARHEVFTPASRIDLDIRVADVVAVLHYADLADAILVGHGYRDTVFAGARRGCTNLTGHALDCPAEGPSPFSSPGREGCAEVPSPPSDTSCDVPRQPFTGASGHRSFPCLRVVLRWLL